MGNGRLRYPFRHELLTLLGQLGQGYTDGIATPVIIKRLQNFKIIAIAAGAKHSIVLTDKGHVLTWGYNANGQTGMKNLGLAMKQTIDGFEEKIVVCIFTSAFSHHNFVQLDNGDMYAFGLNDMDQCGVGNGDVYCAQKVQFLCSRRPFKIVTGFSNSFAFSTNVTYSIFNIAELKFFLDICIITMR